MWGGRERGEGEEEEGSGEERREGGEECLRMVSRRVNWRMFIAVVNEYERRKGEQGRGGSADERRDGNRGNLGETTRGGGGGREGRARGGKGDVPSGKMAMTKTTWPWGSSLVTKKGREGREEGRGSRTHCREGIERWRRRRTDQLRNLRDETSTEIKVIEGAKG